MHSVQSFSSAENVLTLTQLADFAASMTYTMWHTRRPSTKVTNDIKKSSMTYLMWQAKKPVKRMFYDHTTIFVVTSTFKKFCYQILSATQLKDSVVYLCLKYIANLLQANPTIEGAEGSEYRLFVVGLVLASKFLEDNTYTNKSWSEVSGMKIEELNMMEAEFLEAIDFNLCVGAQDFAIWKILLESCRQRYQFSNLDSVQDRQKAICGILHTIGLYDGQFSQDPVALSVKRNVFQEKEERTDHISRITDLLEKSYKKYLASVEQQERQRKAQLYLDDLRRQWQQQSYQTQGRSDQEKLLAPNQLPVTLQPPAVLYGGYSSACRYANRNRRPITNLSQKSWDPLAYSLSCQGSLANAKTNNQCLNDPSPISYRNFY
ncbi:hypothetical protein G6F46_011798 [Rhizopus delemar]|uniref:Cyclin N-terminal domain-containing protein n=3 Tax=Rhizopus TaxID=4842 RepID=I1CVM9_RHIO9|nr:hypothetical protein RO3G_17107 [Rhizopus delemar RA 99-880]KAG1457363.1 hypothetical protein G6F55_005976 [Rhizopus delemar]KAG1547859.1 hypothetical protein G6F51_004020 [Rhizopus arrhizus]KAG1488460.1 hypothetical protein G6F54_012069 [Rhizopus delemar]KAG1493603.1 hypothetical protein G6F53_012725 [Rhizopus delemar]|eukprot:EIE92509.1 hypothetical protein RO3G_17107 [Rhizopus delemar RA 99-880]